MQKSPCCRKKCWMHNMYLFRIWLKNRRGAAPTNSCQPRKTRVASDGSDSRHTLFEERTTGSAFTRSLLGWFQPRISGGAARGLSDSSHEVRIPPMSHSWDFFVCLWSSFYSTKQTKKKVIETIKHNQHCVVSCHSMCLQKLFLIVNPMKVASDGLKEKCV